MTDIINKEALSYLKAKKLKPGFSYQDVWKEEHDLAFTVAKMLQLDMLADVKEALSIALEEGKTFTEFSETLRPYLMSKGWWGEKFMIDPLDGEEKAVKLGSDIRLETIYRTNMRTARAAGQWERIERTKKTHPYLLYELGPSREHRQEHAAWAGTILPVDDPFWKTHSPPNGWGCKCRIRQVSQRESDTLIQTENYQTSAPPLEEQDWINKRTGIMERMPKGIDPGWNYNPGARNQALKKQLETKLQNEK